MSKMYAGKVPELSEGWIKIKTIKDTDLLEWFVFSKAQDHTPDWATYKIIANGRAKNKANYWLARNNKTGQIGFARDYVFLREHRPMIHAKIEILFQNISKDKT